MAFYLVVYQLETPVGLILHGESPCTSIMNKSPRKLSGQRYSHLCEAA